MELPQRCQAPNLQRDTYALANMSSFVPAQAYRPGALRGSGLDRRSDATLVGQRQRCLDGGLTVVDRAFIPAYSPAIFDLSTSVDTSLKLSVGVQY